MKTNGNETKEKIKFKVEWDKLTPEEKIEKLEPRVMLMVKMICDARDIFTQENKMPEEFKKGLEVLNLWKE